MKKFWAVRAIVCGASLMFFSACSLFEDDKQPDSFEKSVPVVDGNSTGIVAGQVVQGAKDLEYEEKVAAQETIILHQEREMRLQQKELEHLQRQEYYNKALEKYQKQ
jgi:hypothetical protein